MPFRVGVDYNHNRPITIFSRLHCNRNHIFLKSCNYIRNREKIMTCDRYSKSTVIKNMLSGNYYFFQHISLEQVETTSARPVNHFSELKIYNIYNNRRIAQYGALHNLNDSL